MKNILNRGFSDYSDDSFVTKVMFIIAQLTGNAAFTITSPTLAAPFLGSEVSLRWRNMPLSTKLILPGKERRGREEM